MSISIADIYQEASNIPLFAETSDLVFGQKVRAIYTNKVRSELMKSLEGDETKVVDSLEVFLKSHWEIIKGSMMNYTSQNQTVITKVLYKAATLVCNYRNQNQDPTQPPLTPLEILMPGVKLESFQSGYKHLKSIKPTVYWNDQKEKELADLQIKYAGLDMVSLSDEEEMEISVLERTIQGAKTEFSTDTTSSIAVNIIDRNNTILKDRLNALLVKQRQSKECFWLTSLREEKKIYLEEHEFCIEKNGWLIPDSKKIEKFLSQSVFYDNTLIPIRLLLEEKDTLINPYSPNYDKIPEEILQRLKFHSNTALAFCEARETLLHYKSDTSTFLGRLMELCAQLKFNDSVEGRGKEENAGMGVYFALINFHDYYKTLNLDQIEKEFPDLYKEIELLLELARNPQKNKNATKTMETCIATRRGYLERWINQDSVKLSKISFEGEKKSTLIEAQEKALKETKNLLANSLDNFTYEGVDPLHMSKNFLNYLNITIPFKSLAEVEQLMTVDPEDIAEIVTKEKGKLIASLFKDLEDLVIFIHEHSTSKLKPFFIATQPHLLNFQIKTILDIKALLLSLSSEKFKVTLEALYNAKLPCWESEKILFYFSHDFELLSKIWDQIPEKERYAKLNLKEHGSRIILHNHARDAKSLKLLLEKLSPQEQINLINKRDIHGNTVLHYSMNEEAMEYLLSLFDKNMLLEVLNKRNMSQESVFHRATEDTRTMCFLAKIIPSVDFKLAIEKRDGRNKTVFHHAINSPHLMKLLLNMYDENERLSIVNQVNNKGDSVLRCALTNYQTLENILEALPISSRLEAIMDKKGFGGNLLHSRSQDLNTIRIILRYLSPADRLIAVYEENNKGKTILDLINNQYGVKILLQALCHKDCLNDEILFLLENKISYKTDKAFVNNFFHECILSFTYQDSSAGKNQVGFFMFDQSSVKKDTIQILLDILNQESDTKELNEKHINYIKSDPMLFKILKSYQRITDINLLQEKESGKEERHKAFS